MEADGTLARILGYNTITTS